MLEQTLTNQKGQNARLKNPRTHPLEPITSLEILIFLGVPLYRSSKLHGRFRTIGGALAGPLADGSPLPPEKDAKISSPKTPRGKRPEPPRSPPIAEPKGLEKPKNSEKMSSALLGLKLKEVGPPPLPEAEKLAAPGGGTCPFSPSSPYWS